ncbi:MAG: DUF2341 domain-containing protein, partial [Gemmatimonadetes bacterium]|nr:DUF2341 domain-containing protein [Gemmatimonadota bacterium]
MTKACQRTFFLSLSLLIMGGLSGSLEAQAFGNGYSFRREIDFTDAQVVSGAHTNFPVLISTTLTDLKTTANGGNVENANGYDIIFTSDQAGNTQLAHEIESYTASTGEIIMWVRIPSLVSTTKIYLFYGNSSISSFQGNVTSNGVTGVWDDNYEGIWHLNEDPSGSAPQMQDGTSNNNDGSSNGSMTSGDRVDAKIGKGIDFDGSNDWIQANDSPSLNLTGTAFTLTAWVKSTVNQNDDTGIIIKGTGLYEIHLGVQGSDVGNTRVYTTSSTYLSGPTVLSQNVWYYMAGIYNGSTLKLYLNGTENATANNSGNIRSTATYALVIGRRAIGDNRFFQGVIDEARISGTARSVPWLQTEYNNQNAPASFYAVGAEEGATATLPFTDNFTRANSSSVGNGWVDTESGSDDAKISNNRLVFDANNLTNSPIVQHTFTSVSSGFLRWTYVFNWDRTGAECCYEVWMQLGNSATMVSPSTSNNTGVAVNLKWAGTSNGMTNHEGFGYVQGASTTEVAVVSGGSGNDHTIEVIANLDNNTFTLKIDGTVQASGVAFDNNVAIDAVRIYADELGGGNFATREFDDLTIETVTATQYLVTSSSSSPVAGSGVTITAQLADV